MNLPESYKIKMQKLLLDDYNEYNNSLLHPRQYGLRINTLKISKDDIYRLINYNFQPVDWCNEGFYYDDSIRPSKSVYYNAGLYYIQEPSAMSAAAALNVIPGDKVLDLCAAPGGKSTQLGAALKNTGVLVSNDSSASRSKGLLKNIELFGIRNALISVERPESLKKKFHHYFDKILVDAPCSGEGMFRKDVDIIKAWSLEYSQKLSEVQKSILNSAKDMLAPSGYILYSTCTFAPEENEENILFFLKQNPDFELVPLPDSMRSFFAPSVPGYLSEPLRKDFKEYNIEYCCRLWPHKINGEGHFLALLHHKGASSSVLSTGLDKKNIVDKGVLSYYYAFVEKFMYKDIGEKFLLHGSSLYSVPQCFPNFDTLRIVRSGIYLGEIKKDRFEPSQAFAMTLSMTDAKYTLNLSHKNDSALIKRYLTGDSFDCSLPDCWALVCVDGFPLGWGKVISSRLKNKYHPGWRINE